MAKQQGAGRGWAKVEREGWGGELGHELPPLLTDQVGSGISFLSDAKDPDQLGRNKITHIISIHESPQPLLQVLLTPVRGLYTGVEGSFSSPQHPFIKYLLCARPYAASLTHTRSFC